MRRVLPQSLPVSGVVGVLVAAVLAAGLLAAACGCAKQSKVSGSKYMSMGDDAISQGKIRTAIVCFEKEIELNPKNPAPHLRLALIYEHLRGDAAKTKYCYEQYFALETNKARRERVEQWRTQPQDEGPLVEASAGNGPPTGDAALAAELQERAAGYARRSTRTRSSRAESSSSKGSNATWRRTARRSTHSPRNATS